MSQAGILNVAGGGGGGTPIQTLTGDDSIAVPPTANNIFLLGGSTSVTNDHGIVTSGNAGTSTETVSLSNRIQNRITTTDAADHTLITFALSASAAAYTFDIEIAAYDFTDDLAAGYSIFGTVRSTASTAVLIGTPDKIVNEEGIMTTCNARLDVSGNNAIIIVNGLAGKTINWNGVATYVVQTKV